MEILTHAIVGCATGATAACGAERPSRRAAILIAGFVGGVMPDIDALSLAPGFDNTVGAFFNLAYSGREIFFGTFPYSHRMALHSLTVPLIIASLIISSIWIIRRRNPGSPALLAAGAFITAYSLHLLCDMVTPAGLWGGIGLFWPDTIRYGGWGLRWWWNNFDITIIGCVITACATLLSFITAISLRLRGIIALSIFITGIITGAALINHGTIDFNNRRMTYAEKTKKSFLIQRRIIGDRLLNIMSAAGKLTEVHPAKKQ